MLVPTGAFTLTLAPLSWVVLSEIFPNRIRGKAMSLATCAMFASSYATVNVFPMVLDGFKDRFGHPGGTFLIFLGICLTCSLFVWLAVPETKGQNPGRNRRVLATEGPRKDCAMKSTILMPFPPT